jgi:hypothetical protein
MSKDTSSCIVSTLIACCVTSLCQAPLGMAVYNCGGFAGIVFHFDLRGGLSLMNLTFENNGKTGSINVGTGTIPGVLFLVTCLWSLAVFFNALFAVGFRDYMIFSASVICGIVTMGVSLITLCSSSRMACVHSSPTLCSSTLGAGAKSFLIPCSSCWSNHLHFGVTGMPMAILFNSFVSSCRCWYGNISGSWQCWGNSSADPDIR